jgi:hypothetical protein
MQTLEKKGTVLHAILVAPLEVWAILFTYYMIDVCNSGYTYNVER